MQCLQSFFTTLTEKERLPSVFGLDRKQKRYWDNHGCEPSSRFVFAVPSLFGKGHVLHSLLDRPVPPGPRKVLLQCQETCLPLCAVLKVRYDTFLAKETLLHEGPIVLGQQWLLPSEPQANYCYWGSALCMLVSRNSCSRL